MLVGARPLHRQQDRATPFAADAKSLDEADDRQDNRAPDTDRLVGWHETDREGGEARDQQGRDQRRLAADAVTEVSEYCRADRTGDKPDRVNGKGLENAGEGIRMRKEQLAEDQAGHDAVKEEVVPLDGGADRAGDDGAPQ